MSAQRAGEGKTSPHSSWVEEQRAAHLYRACAAAESGSVRAELFLRLAGGAEAQSAIWRAQITARGLPPPPPFVADTRTRLVATLVRWWGPRRLQPVLAAMKVRGMMLPAGRAARPARLPSGSASEYRQRSFVSGGSLRAAVFGVNEGLVSNASLILGVTGAGADPRTIMVAGVAGLAAGAFAMAAGEYVAVRSQRELFAHRIALERDEPQESPEAEAQEQALLYAAKSLSQKQARRLAQHAVADADLLDTLAREELGLHPAEPGAPLSAAARSFAAFGAGAALPLLPLLFIEGAPALAVALVLTAMAMFSVGAALSLFTGRGAWFSGARMLALGTLAGAITFGIGHLFAVAGG